MTSAQMRAYGEQNARPDLVLHSHCMAERERLDHVHDEVMAWEAAVAGNVNIPEDLKTKLTVIKTYMLAGAWYGCGVYEDFPEDGIFAEVDRLKAELISLGFDAIRRQPRYRFAPY